MVIDDLADRSHDCDLLLDQNLYQTMDIRYKDLLPCDCKKLLGPRYALLRPEFVEARKNLRQRDGQVSRALVFFGGVDPTNETEKALHALANIVDLKIEVDVVVGSGNLHNEQIQNLCAANEGLHYHCQVDNMAELMAAADLAIGAGGTTTWERCALGLPSIVTVVANNQKELAETGARNGLLYYIGEAYSVTVEKLLDVLKFSMSFPETLQFYSTNCLKTVDAKGVVRVTNLLFPPQITIRPASIEDCDSVYQWRNAEETRHYIFNAEPISLETHRNWFCKTLENPSRILLIGEIEKRPVGVLRYDFSGDEALISVYLVPGGQGQGVGSHLIRCGSLWMRENHPQIKIVNAEIFAENIASLHAFESAGFTQHHMIYKEVL
jgi:spore coat polysaccharide biosynthesis predicted glycosyltransferase SpsG/RimJ/RimL family protein N-acetyltransferase